MSADDKIYLFSSDKTKVTISKNLNKSDECDNLEKNIKKLCKKYEFVKNIIGQNSENNNHKLSPKISKYNDKIKNLTCDIELLMNEIDGIIIENGKIYNNAFNNFDVECI
jgi:hypothetical protein